MTQFSFSFRRATDNDEITLTSGREFRFDIDQYVRYFSKSISPRHIDLLRIAAAIYFTDRLVRRRQRNQQRKWSRSIDLKVGVIDLDFWNDSATKDLLINTLEFLSDDTWTFEFQHDDRRPTSEVQRGMFDVPNDAQITLLSGGLDSAAGLGVRLSTEPAIARIPVTIWHQPIQRKVVLRQYRQLSPRFELLANPLIIKTALIWTPELKRFKQELSQRCRAFLFTAAGAVAASMTGRNSVEVLESGFGAINLPFMAGMVGSRTTRSCHPEFHRRMAMLVRNVCGKPFAFELPFYDKTKGQIVGELKRYGLEELSRSTVSCVHYPLRDSRHKQCGVCPACILRRQSLAVAGIKEEVDTYKFDLFDSPQLENSVPKKHRRYMNAILDQIMYLSTIKLESSIPARVRRHLVGTGIISDNFSGETAMRVLRTYCDEWKCIFVQSQNRGISWTNLIETSDNAKGGAPNAIA